MNWFIEEIKEFYKNEENVKAFEEWKKRKKYRKMLVIVGEDL